MGQNSERNCRYCFGLLKRRATDLEHEPWDIVLYESDNFVIVPTLGSLIEGWVLIVSKCHYVCMGDLPTSVWGELEEVVELASSLIERAYGPPTVFEHGPKEEGLNVGCGVDHAHIHVVPITFSIINEAVKDLVRFNFGGTQSQSYLDTVSELYNEEKSYIYIEEPDSEPYYFAAERVPCQYLRRLIARKIGIEEKYDYNKYYFRRNVNHTIAKTRAILKDFVGK